MDWRSRAKTCSKLDPGCLGWLTRDRPMCESVCESVSVCRNVCVSCVVASVAFLLPHKQTDLLYASAALLCHHLVNVACIWRDELETSCGKITRFMGQLKTKGSMQL